MEQKSLNKQVILERLRRVKAQLNADCSVTELALFGSYSRDEQTSASDIDILIRLEQASYKNLCSAAYALYDLFPEAKVEVVSADAIKPKYFSFVKPDLIYA